jgi:hypothetical protein
MGKTKIERHILLAVVLTAYVVLLAVIGLPRYRESGNWGEFWTVTVFSEGTVILLAYLLKRRDAWRKKNKK